MGQTVNIDSCMILGLILLFNSFVFKNCWCLSLNRNAKTIPSSIKSEYFFLLTISKIFSRLFNQLLVYITEDIN